MQIETSVTVDVFPDPDYKYSAVAGDDAFAIQYSETNNSKDSLREISFASADEMLAVAEAMLKAVKAHRS